MGSIVTAGVAAVLILAILWFAWWWRWSDTETLEGGSDASDLRRLGAGLGLRYRESRPLFGQQIQLLAGSHGPLDVECEIGRGEWGAHARLEIRFPVSLAQDVHVFSHDRSSPLDRIRKIHETEIDDERFDRAFLLFARDDRRLRSYISPRIRLRLLQLEERVDEVRLTDRSLFAYLEGPCDRGEIAGMVKKGIGVARQCVRSARLLGPGSAHRRAEDYESVAFEQGLVAGKVSRGGGADSQRSARGDR